MVASRRLWVRCQRGDAPRGSAWCGVVVVLCVVVLWCNECAGVGEGGEGERRGASERKRRGE